MRGFRWHKWKGALLRWWRRLYRGLRIRLRRRWRTRYKWRWCFRSRKRICLWTCKRLTWARWMCRCLRIRRSSSMWNRYPRRPWRISRACLWYRYSRCSRTRLTFSFHRRTWRICRTWHRYAWRYWRTLFTGQRRKRCSRNARCCRWSF